MKQFAEGELNEKGMPFVHALDRVSLKINGEPVKNKSKFKYADAIKVIIEHTYVWPHATLGAVEYTGIADSTEDNIPDERFKIFLTTIASTRARGRALRAALCLHNIIAAEEEAVKTPDEVFKNDPITDIQIKKLEMLCKRLDIDIVSFINSGQVKYKSIRDINRGTALKMSEILEEIESKKRERNPKWSKFNKDWNKR